MKKNTSRISKILLACVPLLLVSSITTHAEDNNLTTITETPSVLNTPTTDSSTLDSLEGDTATLLPIAQGTIPIKTTIGGTGTISLAQFRGQTLEGEFVPENNNIIDIDAKGVWKAKAIGTEKITIKFKPNADFLDTYFNGEVFSEIFVSEPISVTVEDVKKDSTVKDEDTSDSTTEPTDSTTDSTDNVDKVKASLQLVESSLKSTDGTLEVKVKDGEKVTGEFTAVNTDTFVLDTKGKYSIPEKSQEKALKQTVKFTLDKESVETLTKLDAYKGKDIETTYEFEVTKKAQKNIVLTFTNNKITTTVGSTSRFILNDYDGVKIEGEFTPLTDNTFLSVDKLGNWKALKAGSGDFTPGFNVSDDTLKALQEKYPDTDLKITNEKVTVSITDSTNSSTTKKTYAPVSNLPKTGEEKLRFAGIIGVVLVAIVALLFFLKRKNNKDDE